MGVGIDAMKSVPQRLKPALRKPVIAAPKRCATQDQVRDRFFSSLRGQVR